MDPVLVHLNPRFELVYPYSETLGKWFPKYILHKDFEYLASPSKMLKDLNCIANSVCLRKYAQP